MNHFPFKLYDMLQYAANSEYSSAASWSVDGRAFIIHRRDVFLENLVPLFFKQTKFRSFTRQLNLWGFSRPSDFDEWAHPNFIRGSSERLELIRRVEVKGSSKDQKRRTSISRSARSSTTTFPIRMLSFPSSNDSSSAYNNTSFSSDDNRSANVDNNVTYAMMVSPTTSNVEYLVDAVGSSTIGTNYQTPTSNVDNNDSFTTITRPLSCLPFSFYSTGDIIHPYVEPISVHGTNTASLYDNVVDDFKFELSQVLGVEPRPTHRSLDDLDSILSWNEVSND
ncbi:hypothetical protein ACHAXH_002227 [Discostella pseudostelligera]